LLIELYCDKIKIVGDYVMDCDIKKIIKEVSDSMESKGYNSITQIVGYLISNDIGYIPDFDDDRNKMATLDRTLILEDMMSEYLK